MSFQFKCERNKCSITSKEEKSCDRFFAGVLHLLAYGLHVIVLLGGVLHAVVSPRGNGWVWIPTSVQTRTEIFANLLESVLYLGGGEGLVHVYCNFYCSPAKKNCSDPSYFELATPLFTCDRAASLWLTRDSVASWCFTCDRAARL